MKRTITGFRTDDDGDWVALLDCGHPQHVRHNPPFTNRPWVVTEEGRNNRLGEMLDCVRCDRFELPEHFIPYKQTPIFTETSLPDGLKKDHSTKTGVWAKIIVSEGKLLYRVAALKAEMVISPGPEQVRKIPSTTTPGPLTTLKTTGLVLPTSALPKRAINVGWLMAALAGGVQSMVCRSFGVLTMTVRSTAAGA